MNILKTVDVKCPICDTINKGLYMEETDGWMECEKCKNVVRILKYAKTIRLPLYRIPDRQVLIPLTRKMS